MGDSLPALAVELNYNHVELNYNHIIGEMVLWDTSLQTACSMNSVNTMLKVL